MSLLDHQLLGVARRYRRLDWWRSISIACMLLVIAGGVLLALQMSRTWMYPHSGWVLLAAGLVSVVLVTIVSARRFRDEGWVARQVEYHFPELEQRLLTTLDECERNQGRPLGYLQHTVFQETITHAYHNPWTSIVSPQMVRQFRRRGLVALCLMMAVAIGLMRWQPDPRSFAVSTKEVADEKQPLANFDIKVEPGNTEVEKGTNLIVIARFGKQVPKEAELVATSGSEELRIPMSRSLDDPLFGGTISEVLNDLEYYIAYDGRKSETYRATVFMYPELVRADALVEFPSYTEMADKRVEDTRRVSVVEGTRVTWEMHLNKPGIEAELVPIDGGDAIPLQLDATDPLNHLVSIELKQTVSWKLVLKDADARENRSPPTITAKVTPNRPPTLKLDLARDARVSPLEEFLVKATVSDDYGLRQFGLNYTLASASAQDIVLGEESPRREKQVAEHMLDFEALEASPDELLSYYFWAEDQDAEGHPRRTLSDMFFAEVRHFEEIFRQGQQPPGGQQQQQQQQQGEQSQNAQDAEQLAELQKQIINASWTLIRRETAAEVTAAFEPDVSTILESQQTAAEQSAQLGQTLQDSESQQHLLEVRTQMQESLKQLTSAYSDKVAEPLTPAMQAQRAAYQALLKLRAREHEVTQGQQQPGQRSQSSSSSRMQQQLQQLQLQNDENRYETQRQAQEQQDQEQTEMRQALSRLRELAQRQEDLNEQLKELQTALEQAETEEEREEIERQLKRLREQQEEMLRDTDELMDRLDESQNQETLQETQEQLEQTREQLRDSAESLEKGEVTPALASGTRAQRELEEMREQLRRESANQFSEQMKEMRDKARDLESTQEEIGQRLEQQNSESSENAAGLRDELEPKDEAISEALREQNEKLNRLLQEIEETVREAEESEPLLAENLYDAFRETEGDFVQRNLELAAQATDRGLAEQAQRLEVEAREGISNLRENIEQAAESVLGDETDALRTAVRMLEELERQLDNEINQFDDSPNRDGEGQNRDPAGRPTDPTESEPGDQPNDRQGNDRQREQENQQRERQDEGQPGSQQQPGREQRSPEQAQNPRGQGQPNESEGQQSQNQESQEQASQSQSDSPGQSPSENQESQNQESQGPSGAPSESQSESSSTQQQGGQPSDQEGQRGGQRQQQRRPQSLRPGGDRQQRQDGGGSSGFEQLDVAPITGDDFRQWSDRLRDVEEIVDDPDIRAEAARIRERARAFRGEFKRHSEEPKWDLVKELVSRPLRELRQDVSEELLRRSAEKNALIPIDRDPVPEEFVEQVRRYRENLGRGNR